MRLKIYSIVLLIGLMTSCKEDILDYKNPAAYDEATYFQTTEQMTKAITATYAVFLHRAMNREYYFAFDLMSSDAEKNTFLLGDDADFYTFTFSPNQTYVNEMWKSLYRMRTRATIVEDKAETFKSNTPAEAQYIAQIKGEALFLKSYAYYKLVQIYGDVPYAETWKEIKDPTTFARKRMPESEILGNLERNLAAAIELLPENWDNANVGRATKYSAMALLGKVLLEQQKYAEALVQFKKIEESGKFSMWEGTEGYAKQFSVANSNSPETIFDVRHAPWLSWAQGHAYYMFGGVEAWGYGQVTHSGRAQEYSAKPKGWNNMKYGTGAARSFIYAINGANYVDPRASLTFYGGPTTGGDMDVAGVPYDYRAERLSWKKYQLPENEDDGVPNSGINTQIIRYADVLLMIAECYIFQDNYAAAMPYINQVRARVGATSYNNTPASFDEAFSILERERRLELSGEQVRWFDLKRWDLATKKASGFSMTGRINADRALDELNKPRPMEEKFKYFPIPVSERDNNPLVETGLHFENWN